MDSFSKHSHKHYKTNFLPLRWFSNICGSIATEHLLKALNLDEDEDYGLKYRYHAKLWRILNFPYSKWGTYYTIDLNNWKKELNQMRIDMSDEGWDDYDAFGKAYWENKEDK